MTVPIQWVAVRATPRPPLEDCLGLVCMAFAVGQDATRWLEALRASPWNAYLEPPLGALRSGELWRNECAIEAPDAAVPLSAVPQTSLATVAVFEGDRSAVASAQDLVVALKRRLAPDGHPLVVVVTLDALSAHSDDVVGAFARRGAFVITRAPGCSEERLHQFPLAAAVRPQVQLIGVDLGDYLGQWLPGRTATLHGMQTDIETGPPALQDVRTSDVCALTLLMHVDLESEDFSLRGMDRLATLCREATSLGDAESMIFTTADRPDGLTGTADLLVVHESDMTARRQPPPMADPRSQD